MAMELDRKSCPFALALSVMMLSSCEEERSAEQLTPPIQEFVLLRDGFDTAASLEENWRRGTEGFLEPAIGVGEFRLDETQGQRDPPCLRLQDAVVVSGPFSASPGDTFVLRGRVRASGCEEYPSSRVLASAAPWSIFFLNDQQRWAGSGRFLDPFVGSFGWKQIQSIAEAPPTAVSVSVSIGSYGPGEAWVDDVELVRIGR